MVESLSGYTFNANIAMSKLQIIDELHRIARKKYSRRKTLMRGINETLQIDLAEMSQHFKENKNFKYILVAIDIFSKFVWTKPLKSKTATEVTNAMHSILSNIPPVKNIQSDAGKEFFNSHFRDLMNKYGINHYTTYSKTKCSICERVIRTLKTKIYKRFHIRGEYKWFDILDDIVHEYNNTKHRTIKMKPSEVTKKNEAQLLNTVYKYTHIMTDKKFKLGDHVRISKYKKVFDKGYLPNWTTEIFTIYKINETNPVTYLLKDYNNVEIAGAFYEPELQKVRHPDVYLVEKILKSSGNKVYVKWLGFDSTHNSWVNKSSIQV